MRMYKVLCIAVATLLLGMGNPASGLAQERLTLGTASMGGNYFSMGAVIAKVLNDHIDTHSVTAQATGGSSYNLFAIEDGEIDFGISQGPAVMAAISDESAPSVRTLINYNGTPQHVLVRKDAGIASLQDLKGKKLELIAAGDGVEVSSRKVIESVGLNWDDVKHEYSGNRVQAASRLKTGQVDAIIDATGVGAAWMTDVINSGKFELLSLTPEEMDAIMAKNPEFAPMPIAAGVYAGQDNVVNTIGNWTIIVGSKDLSDDVVYTMLKVLFENKAALVEGHSFFKDLAPSNINGALLAPLHPGAERFYKEQGVL